MWMELSLVRDVRNKNGLFRYTGHRRQAEESKPPLIMKRAYSDAEKAEEFFASVFAASQTS